MLIEEILTARELAKVLKVSQTSVRNWKTKGMPHRRLGPKLVRFELRAALGWLEGKKENAQG